VIEEKEAAQEEIEERGKVLRRLAATKTLNQSKRNRRFFIQQKIPLAKPTRITSTLWMQ
jgi:hypothetical protein